MTSFVLVIVGVLLGMTAGYVYGFNVGQHSR